ncbi:MAG: UDP-N-acetylmuramate dehydrogenase [Verrucomicrobia bacterium]|nr:UDP-N-acetylmuramate dehydrogenase [Verrucomicrobiota bacterium]
MAIDPPFLAALTRAVSPAALVRRDEPLAARTTIRIGGPADCYFEPASESDLARGLALAARHGVPVTLMGRGSNLLIRDGGIRGLVICLAHPEFSRVEVLAGRLHAGAGARLKTLVAAARRHRLTGLEFLEGIPGSLGGALRMNAGAMGLWIFQAVERLRIMDRTGTVSERAGSEVPTEYRACPLLREHVALGAVLKGAPAAAETIADQMTRFSRKRRESQPAAPSAGCVFKNPPAIAAGRLIEELGLKGHRVGGAMVSDVHGNFIVNAGNATARDVLALIALVQHAAKSRRDIHLEPEVQIVGED